MDLTRRQLLTGIGGGALMATPLEQLLSSVASGLFNKAYAKESSSQVKNLIYFHDYGAPPRWMFDLFLNPDGDSQFVRNRFMGDVYAGSGDSKTEVDFAWWQHKGLNLPWMWQFEAPSPNGQTKNMCEHLLPNLLQIRGVHSLNVEHFVSDLHWDKPPNSFYGVHGVVADNSNLPFSTVAISRNLRLGSLLNLTPTIISPDGSDRNFLLELMDPFIVSQSEVDSITKNAIDSAAARFKKMQYDLAGQYNEKYENFSKVDSSVYDLLHTSVEELNLYWDERVLVYDELIRRSFTTKMNQIHDHPVGDKDAKYPSGFPQDLRDLLVEETTIVGLSQNFVLAEFLLLKNLSNSISCTFANTQFLSLDSGYYALNSDEHIFNFLPSLIINTNRHLAVGACLIEFISFLKRNNLFDKSLVCHNSEFNRNLRKNDGGGTDHAYSGGHLNIYSGRIKKLHIVGNIRKHCPDGWKYGGTDGSGALNPEIEMRLDVNHIPPTLAKCMGLPYKGINDRYQSLVEVDPQGYIAPILGPGKIIDE